jgi:chromosome segregation ATPase
MKAKVENEERLKHLVADLEKQKQDLSETLRVLGPNYSKAIEDKGKAEAGREAVVRRADKLDQLVQTRVQELLKAKEEKAALETELAAARAAISNSSVPEAAALVQAEDKIKSLEEENSKLTKKADSVQNTLNYIQDAYQKQSSHLTELQSELQDLTRENEILKRQASDNKVKIAEIQGKYATEQLNERIDELEAQLRETVRDRDKTKEELRIRTNGRRETRGTSIPRSPAMGNSASGTMSPRQGPQFVGRAGGGSNSRGSSPAPGDSFGRDPPLFPGGHPPSRLSSMPYGIN